MKKYIQPLAFGTLILGGVLLLLRKNNKKQVKVEEVTE